MLAELHARWEREAEIDRKNSIARVCTITTSNAEASHVDKPPTINGNVIDVGNVSTSTIKHAKLPKTAETVSDKGAEFFEVLEAMVPLLLIIMILILIVVTSLKLLSSCKS